MSARPEPRNGFIAPKLSGFALDRFGAPGRDRYLTRLLFLRNFAYHIDVQQAVFKLGAVYDDMLSEIEPPLECSFRYAAV